MRGLSAYPMCTDAETYSSCVGAVGVRGNFNTDLIDRRDIERYSDAIDSNPYVVGSQAWNLAHGLPIGPAWYERNLTDAAIAAGDAAAAATPGPGKASAIGLSLGGAESPSLLPLLAIGILALVLLKR